MSVESGPFPKSCRIKKYAHFAQKNSYLNHTSNLSSTEKLSSRISTPRHYYRSFCSEPRAFNRSYRELRESDRVRRNSKIQA